VCDRHGADNNQNPALADIIAMDIWARQAVLEASQKLSLATV
jgi:1-deoxy-D-xylulose-5-phosphate reductoisomerase